MTQPAGQAWSPSGRTAALILLVACLAPFAPVLLGGKALFGSDELAIGLPVRLAAQRALAAGSLPWWLPDLFCGLPGIGALTTDILHPSGFLLQALRLPVTSAYGYDMALQALLGALGMLFFGRRALNLSWPAALAAALSFGLSGTQLSPIYAGHTNNVKAIAMIPWAFWGLWEAAGSGKRWGIALCGLALGAQGLGVGLQVAAYTGLGLAGLAAWISPPEGRTWRWKLACLAGAGALGAALAAPQLLPALSYKAHSLRQDFSYESFTSWSFPPREALTWFVPGFFGWGEAAYWGGWDFSLTTEYLGLLPWMLAAAAVAAHWKSQRQGALRFLLGLAAFSLLAALGKHFPLHQLFYRLPVFEGFRAWVRFLCLATFALCALAGLGWDALFSGEARARKAALYAAGAIALAAFLSLVLAEPALRAAAAKSKDLAASKLALTLSAQRSLGLALAFGLVLAALPLAAARGRLAMAAWALLALSYADLRLVSQRYLHYLPAADLLREPGFAPALRDALSKDPGRIEVLGGSNPNRAATWGLPMAGGYLGLPPARLQKLREKLGNKPDLFFALANVKLLLMDREVQAPWLRLLAAEGYERVYQDLSSLPPARLVFKARPAQDETQALDLMAALTSPEEAVVEGASAPLPSGGQGVVRTLAQGQGMLEADVDLNAPGLLLLSQSWFPGWRATVDGKEAEVLRTNVAFQGVLLPGGRHQVRLKYHQPGLALALVLFIAGLVACTWLFRAP